MKQSEIDISVERKIIEGLIYNDDFVKRIQPAYDSKYLKTRVAKLISNYCMKYYEKYSVSPKSEIKSLIRINAVETKSEDDIDSLEALTESIEEKRDDHYNLNYWVEKAESYFNRRKLDLLSDAIKESVNSDDVQSAELEIANHKNIKISENSGFSIIRDRQTVKDILMQEDDELFAFAKDLGKLIGPFIRGDLAAFIGPGKRGKCLAGDSTILLSSGEMCELRDVVKQNIKNTLSLEESGMHLITSTVSNHYDNGVKDVYRITTKSGRCIKITNNHPLRTFCGTWKSIDDGLSIGDHIAVPKKIPIFGNKKIPIDHVRLIAYLLADGGLTDGNVTYHKLDKELKDEVKRIVESFGDKVNDYNELTFSITKKHHGPGLSETRKLLSFYGVDRVKSIYKEIPKVIFTLPKAQIREFIKSLFSGDGSIFNRGIEYSSGCEVLIRQVQHLLLRFGIVSKITCATAKINGGNYWKLAIRDGQYIISYIKQIGFFGVKGERIAETLQEYANKTQRSYLDVIPFEYRTVLKEKLSCLGTKHKLYRNFMKDPNSSSNITMSKLHQINKVLKDKEVYKLLASDIMWDKILKIEYVGKEQTYDLTIPVYHNFIANDICVHNTWILIETAIQALMRKYKVLFISLEMNARSIIKRVTQNLFSETAKEEEYMYPRFVKNGDMYEIDNSKIEKGKGLKLNLYDRKLKAFLPQIGGGDLRICCYPAYSADYKKIFSDIELLEVKSGWLPDFIIIDYADLIAPESQKGDRRDQIDLVWKRLRALAQMKNCSVITATHSNKQTFERNIKQNDLSDDNRKINHVGKMISLNQTFSEKKIGAMRMQMIAERNGFFDDTEVVVLQSLNIGKPFLDALYKDKIEDYTEKYQKKS